MEVNKEELRRLAEAANETTEDLFRFGNALTASVVIALLDELESCKRDAERLDFLVRTSGDFYIAEKQEDWLVLDCRDGLSTVKRGFRSMREAIDAAMDRELIS